MPANTSYRGHGRLLQVRPLERDCLSGGTTEGHEDHRQNGT